MTILRMDNVGIVFEDLDASVAFFVDLGLELEGRMTVEGQWSDRIVGLDGQRVDIAMMRTPDGHSKLELMSYQKPTMISSEPKNAPPNTLGIRRLMFAVTDIQDTIARLRTHSAELIGEVVRYEDLYLLCYLRGPEGIIVALAEDLKMKYRRASVREPIDAPVRSSTKRRDREASEHLHIGRDRGIIVGKEPCLDVRLTVPRVTHDTIRFTLKTR